MDQRDTVNDTGTSSRPDIVYAYGLVSLSACVPDGLTIEEVTAQVNEDYPTGIQSQWAWAKGEPFADGSPNPCPCERGPHRKHYLFHC